MDELIASVAEQIGVEEEVAKKAVGAVLKFIKENQDKIDFEAILEKLEGAQELVATREAEEETSQQVAQPGGGGIFGLVFSILKILGVIAMLKSFLQPIFGDGAVKLIDSVEDGAELADVMNKLGIDAEQGSKITKMLFTFMKDKLDADLVEQLLEAVPAVKAFVGDLKKEE